MEVLIFIVVTYIIISVLIGIIDFFRFMRQEKERENSSRGAKGYYVKPKEIFGSHNWIFFPSLAIILILIWIILLIDRVFS